MRGQLWISAVIAPSGKIVSHTDLSTMTMIYKRIGLRQEQTFYLRWGDWFVLVCLGGVGFDMIASLWPIPNSRRSKRYNILAME